jgi:nucleotide-binding universal stress UspA family protein
MGSAGSIHGKRPEKKELALIQSIIQSEIEQEFKKISSSGCTGQELEAKLNQLIHNNENSLRYSILQKAKTALGHSMKVLEDEVNVPENERTTDVNQSVETFREICVNSIETIRLKNQYRFIVGIDGTNGGHVAYENALILRKKIDHLSLFHVWNNKHQADMLQQKYDVLLTTAGIKPELYQFLWKEAGNDSVQKILMDLVEELAALAESPFSDPTPDFFVCGTTHSIQQGFSSTTLGSVADLALRRVHLPVIITKGKIPPKGPKKYIMAVDDSEQSKRGFDILLTLLAPKDTLIIVHVCCKSDATQFVDESGEITIAKIKTYYENEIDTLGPVDSKVVMLAVEGGTTPVNCLIDYVNNENHDFLDLAPRAQIQNTSFTESVMYKVYAAIILCKS